MKHILRGSYNRSAPGYDAEFRDLQRAKYAALFGPGGGPLAALLGAGARALDLGCGTGLLAEWLGRAGASLVGLDLSHGMLLAARRRGLRAVEGDLERLPFRDGAFAAIVSFTALRIVPGPDAPALVEVARVLGRGGVFAVSVLKTTWDPDFERELRAAGLRPGPRKDCGQDYGYLCTRG